ncbi:MAG: hypothetical protein J6Y80_07645 [Victivallales bacterium]|nr:hypothetical protein [Victivallales bacterium]
MFAPTFKDLPAVNRLLIYAVMAMLAATLLVLYLYVMPKWHQFQSYQKSLREKEQRLATTPWPQDGELLRHQFEIIREKLDGSEEDGQVGLAQLSEDILQQAAITFQEPILSQFSSPAHFIATVSRIDYKDVYDRFAQELAEEEKSLDPSYFGLQEDGQEPVWQMILKLWTAQLLCKLARQNHLALQEQDGIADVTALPPIAYAVTEEDAQPPYLLEFPVRLRLKGTLQDFLKFTQELSTPIRFLPLKQLEISTLPPDPPLPGQVNRVDQATFVIVCSSFLQPNRSEHDAPSNE